FLCENILFVSKRFHVSSQRWKVFGFLMGLKPLNKLYLQSASIPGFSLINGETYPERVWNL
ncbi:MAG TPA: hypothetical protein PLF99_06635, partial [Tenuifilaceae bacterium]|nr:hypothetical protein [Tenuifilaceae bacterium]